jgi:hypothetical protein
MSCQSPATPDSLFVQRMKREALRFHTPVFEGAKTQR